METFQRVANEILRLRSTQKPLILAFGRNFAYTDKLEKKAGRDPPKQCFLQGETRDSKTPEEATIAAVPIEWNLAKYVVPGCDLLDHEFDFAR